MAQAAVKTDAKVEKPKVMKGENSLLGVAVDQDPDESVQQIQKDAQVLEKEID